MSISEPAIIDRKVIHSKDKLIAVAGVVTQPEHLWGDTYMAGYLAFGSA